MIHRNPRRGDSAEIVFECDGCDEILETGQGEWSAAMDEFKAEHWKAEKVGTEWTHLCPACH